MLSNALFSVFVAVCALFCASVSADHGHAAAHFFARDEVVTSTSTYSSTSTIYKTITVKKTDKYATAYSGNGTAVYKSYNSTAPYYMHNTTTYARPTATAGTTVILSTTASPSPSPITSVVPGSSTTAAPASTVVASGAGRIGSFGGVMGVAAIMAIASLF